MPTLSIITINLNNAAGLQKTIESVAGQTSPDMEYIVIDGGSTDGSVAVIEQYQHRIIYWVSEPDGGIYSAMNKGIRQATGTYCQFLNSGDYLMRSDVTERMLTNLPDASIVYGNEVREVNGRFVSEKSYAGRPITLLDLYRSTIFHSSAYIKRNLFDRYGLYDESLKIVSDWKFYLTTVGLHNESVAWCDIDVTCFDMRGISSANKELDRQERAQVLHELLPRSIHEDYKKLAVDSVILNRLRQNRLSWFVVLNLYRILFRIDKVSRRAADAAL